MDKVQLAALDHMGKKLVDDDEKYLLVAKDPLSPLGYNTPAITSLMFKVCGNDTEKFDEACRLVRIFAITAIELQKKEFII